VLSGKDGGRVAGGVQALPGTVHFQDASVVAEGMEDTLKQCLLLGIVSRLGWAVIHHKAEYHAMEAANMAAHSAGFHQMPQVAGFESGSPANLVGDRVAAWINVLQHVKDTCDLSPKHDPWRQGLRKLYFVLQVAAIPLKANARTDSTAKVSKSPSLPPQF